MNYSIYLIAQEAAAAAASQDQPQAGGPNMLVMFILIFVIFYFIAIRPQSKRQKELKARQDALKPGDKVVSAGGIYGIVREVQEAAVKMEVAPNVVIKIVKSQIVHTIAKDGSVEN